MRPGIYSGRGNSAGRSARTPFDAAAALIRTPIRLLCMLHAFSACSGILCRHDCILHVGRSAGCEGPGMAPCALHEGRAQQDAASSTTGFIAIYVVALAPCECSYRDHKGRWWQLLSWQRSRARVKRERVFAYHKISLIHIEEKNQLKSTLKHKLRWPQSITLSVAHLGSAYLRTLHVTLPCAPGLLLESEHAKKEQPRTRAFVETWEHCFLSGHQPSHGPLQNSLQWLCGQVFAVRRGQSSRSDSAELWHYWQWASIRPAGRVLMQLLSPC